MSAAAAAGGAYAKLERKVGDFATVGVAAVLTLDVDGVIERGGIGVTGVRRDAVRGDRRRGGPRRPAPTEDLFRAGARRRPRQSRPADVRGPSTTSGRWSPR